MRHLFLGRPPAHVSWPDTHTLQSTVTQRHLDGLPARLALHPTVTQRHLDGLTATRVQLLLEEAHGESVEMRRARETEEVPLSVVHLRLKALVVLSLWGRSVLVVARRAPEKFGVLGICRDLSVPQHRHA